MAVEQLLSAHRQFLAFATVGTAGDGARAGDPRTFTTLAAPCSEVCAIHRDLRTRSTAPTINK